MSVKIKFTIDNYITSYHSNLVSSPSHHPLDIMIVDYRRTRHYLATNQSTRKYQAWRSGRVTRVRLLSGQAMCEHELAKALASYYPVTLDRFTGRIPMQTELTALLFRCSLTPWRQRRHCCHWWNEFFVTAQSSNTTDYHSLLRVRLETRVRVCIFWIFTLTDTDIVDDLAFHWC